MPCTVKRWKSPLRVGTSQSLALHLYLHTSPTQISSSRKCPLVHKPKIRQIFCFFLSFRIPVAIWGRSYRTHAHIRPNGEINGRLCAVCDWALAGVRTWLVPCSSRGPDLGIPTGTRFPTRHIKPKYIHLNRISIRWLLAYTYGKQHIIGKTVIN